MKDITVRDIINKCGGKLLVGDNLEETCNNFCIDTRQIEKGDIYVGIKGDNFDGNLFYKQALENGAKGCIISSDIIEEKYDGKFIIKVEDTVKALQDLSKYKRSLYNIEIVAVTGSVGKTSTKDIIASVMGTKYKVLKTKGNFNNHIGLPITLLSLRRP